jgi:hypothetical protein
MECGHSLLIRGLDGTPGADAWRVNRPASTSQKVTRANSFAIDPPPAQASSLWSHIGASHFAYNHTLGLVSANWQENPGRKEAGEEVTNDDYLSTSHFGLLYLWSDIRDEDAPWWGENGSSAYNDFAQRLSKAFTNFHQGRAGFPQFKKKRQGVGSVGFTNQAVRLTDSHHVRVSRVGEMKTFASTRKLYRHLERGTGRILAATVSCRNGQWKISLTYEIDRQVPMTRPPERVIGIDVGVMTLYTGATPDGERVLSVPLGTTPPPSSASPRPSTSPAVVTDPGRATRRLTGGNSPMPGSRRSTYTRPTSAGTSSTRRRRGWPRTTTSSWSRTATSPGC